MGNPNRSVVWSRSYANYHIQWKKLKEDYVFLKDRIVKGPDPYDGKFSKKPQFTECLCEGKGDMTQITEGESRTYQLHHHKQSYVIKG